MLLEKSKRKEVYKKSPKRRFFGITKNNGLTAWYFNAMLFLNLKGGENA